MSRFGVPLAIAVMLLVTILLGGGGSGGRGSVARGGTVSLPTPKPAARAVPRSSLLVPVDGTLP